MHTRTLSKVIVLVAAGWLLTSCGSTTSETSATQSTPAPQNQAGALSIRDAWVKSADQGMTAAFGVLVNDGRKDVRVTAATSDASPIMELHETVENESGETVMREKEGGFVIPSGGEYILEPGANHLMLMDLERPVRAGEKVTFSLVMADGSSYEFSAVAKDYSGANERYVESE